MSIVWYNEEAKDIVITLTAANLTINKAGSVYFESANQVMLGFDKTENTLVIKPLSKAAVLRGDIPEHTRYNITVKASYSRVANKPFIQKVASLFELKLDDKGTKFKANWLESKEMLVVLLKEAI